MTTLKSEKTPVKNEAKNHSMNVKKNLLIKILLCLVEDSLVSTCDDDSTNDTIVKMATILVKIRTVVSTIMMLK